ncbi:hypothetical protein V5O48_015542 [Marasmius crinis-equi]|uniref:WD40 repeat-like protein n=1 Tax=Marasmius crinis-equi TaxID=585013 RepID=A0ABR3EU87_9AGAR
MIAVTTTDSLTILEPSVLKKPPPSVASSSSLDFEPSATCWSTDNTALYAASSNTISRYQPGSSELTQIYDGEADGEGTIGSMVCKDASTLIFSLGPTVHFLESCSTKPKLSSSKYTTHKSPITSLSLSTDATLLLSTSTSGAHIHNLTLNSTTTLRGLSTSVTTGSFHTHLRTRVLIGSGNQLLVYDSARPSTPLKTFTLGEGEIGMISCSPFSKTLVAVGMVGVGAGVIALVDLEKEKGLFRTIDTKVPITSLSFSPEGALIYAGTATGKILVLDLRSLDKLPSGVEIMGASGRVVSISVQKKISATPSSRKTSTAPSSTATSPTATTRRAVSISKPGTPAIKRVVSTSRPSTTTATKTGTITTTAKRPTEAVARKVFSPIRSPLATSRTGNRNNGANESPSREEFSVKLETLGTLRRGHPSPGVSTAKKETTTTRTRTVSTVSRATSVVSRAPATTTSPKLRASPKAATINESISAAASSRPGRTRTKSGSGSGSVPPVPPLPKGLTIGDVARPASRTGTVRERTRTRTRTTTKTPSPDLPSLGDIDVDDVDRDPAPPAPLPTTPATKKGKGKGADFRALGLGTPGGKGKTVEFADDDDQDEGDTESESDDTKSSARPARVEDVDSEGEADELSMQISPARRRIPSLSETLNNLSPSHPGPSPGNNGQTLLRNIVHSVLSDFHLQTHREMTNLHLDLVRMGRGLRGDVREVVREEMEGVLRGVVGEMREDLVREIRDGVGGTTTAASSWEMRELKEENRRLREENERLRGLGGGIGGGGSGAGVGAGLVL